MVLTEDQVSKVTKNIENFEFPNMIGEKVKASNLSVAPDNIIRIATGSYVLVVTADLGISKAIACYVGFNIKTMEVVSMMTESQVDRQLAECGRYFQTPNA